MEDLGWLETLKDLSSYGFLLYIFGYMVKLGFDFILERERKHIPELSDMIKSSIESSEEANKEYISQLKEITTLHRDQIANIIEEMGKRYDEQEVRHKEDRDGIINKFAQQLDMAAELSSKKENAMIETLSVIKELLVEMRTTQVDEIEKSDQK